jgi:hypothetical protein
LVADVLKRRLFRLDASLLGPPFCGLGLLQGTKCLGGLLVARENLLSEIGELGALMAEALVANTARW